MALQVAIPDFFDGVDMTDPRAIAVALSEFKHVSDIEKKIEGAKSEEEKKTESDALELKRKKKDATCKAKGGNSKGFRQLLTGMFSPTEKSAAVISPPFPLKSNHLFTQAEEDEDDEDYEDSGSEDTEPDVEEMSGSFSSRMLLSADGGAKFNRPPPLIKLKQ